MISRRRFRRGQSAVNCREVGRVLQSYLDNDVEAGFAVKIAEHLDACKDCGLERETYQQIKESLGGRCPAVDEAGLARLREFGESLTGN